MEKINKVIKIVLLSIVFLLPIFWLPFSFDGYEFLKVGLLFFLTSLCFLLWLIKSVFFDKKISFFFGLTDLFVLLFLITSLVSFIFSADKKASLMGVYANNADSIFALVSFVVFYFLLRNLLAKDGVVSLDCAIRWFLGSFSLVLLTALFSVFGFWQKLPFVSLQNLSNSFNLASFSLEGLAVFVSIVTSFVGAAWICSLVQVKGKYALFLLLLGFFFLVIVDYNPAWFILLISSLALLIFPLINRLFKEDPIKLLLPIILILACLFFLRFNLKNNEGISLFLFQKEIVLDRATSWRVTFDSAKSSFKNAFFGYGQGTWYYQFLSRKPLSFNEEEYWNLRFANANSYIIQLLAATGIIGVLFYAALIGAVFMIFWRAKKDKSLLPFVIVFLAVLASQFFYYQNAVLAFSFWLFLALVLSVLFEQEKPKKIEKSLSFEKVPELYLVPTVLLIIFSLLVFTAYYFLAEFYLADTNYLKANLAASSGQRIEFLVKAVNQNPYNVNYRTALAREYLSYALERLQDPEADQNSISVLVDRAIEQGEIATVIFPKDITVWETLAVIYREIGGMEEKVVSSFEKAIELEPISPVLHTELGKVYLKQENTESAKVSFNKAVELKPDYSDALFQQGLLLEQEGDIENAILKAKEIERLFPLDKDLKLWLGNLYSKLEDTEKSIYYFEIAVYLDPTNFDSLYYLGQAYSKNQEKEKAITVFERILELYPDTEGIQELIDDLEG